MATQGPLGTYAQLCPVAAGTDAVGDRWTLLLLRDLAHVPLRFSELEAANPGISPSMLTKRLTRLEADGVVTTISGDRRGQKRYQLNPLVRNEVLAVLDAVSQLGTALAPEQPVTSAQLIHQLNADRAWFLAKHHRTEGVFEFVVDEAHISLAVDQHRFEATEGAPASPTAVVTCAGSTMLAINTTEISVADAIEQGLMTVTGDVDAVTALFEALSAPYIGASGSAS